MKAEEHVLYNWLLGQERFFDFLAQVDLGLAQAMKQRVRCPDCGGPLDFGRYVRKPRGGPRLPESCKRIHGLCCRVIGCRERQRPPSVLFLDRRVYLGAAMIMASVMADGATPRRLRSLAKWIGGTTIARWRQWWRDEFPEGLTGKTAFAHVVGLDASRLPAQLFESFVGPPSHRLSMMLELLATHGARAGPIVLEA